MELKKIDIKNIKLPEQFIEFIGNHEVYDSSCSETAQTIFIDREDGFFLKISAGGNLSNDAVMTKYFGKKGLSAQVIQYVSNENDYLLTTKIPGEDGISRKYIDEPTRLCDTFAQSLRMLHETSYSDCLVQHRVEAMISDVEHNYKTDNFDDEMALYCGTDDRSKVYKEIMKFKNILKNDVLMHGDYCLPNILLNDFNFSGFIDVGYGGVGDRHYDLFWGVWTLWYNLKPNNYMERFLDAYGRDVFDSERYRICGLLSTMNM